MPSPRNRLVSLAVGAALVVAAPLVSASAASAATSAPAGSSVSGQSVSSAPVTVRDGVVYRGGEEVVIDGTAVPGATVLVSLPGVAERGFVDVTPQGTWQYAVQAELVSGSFSGNTVTAVLPSGERVQVGFSFEVR